MKKRHVMALLGWVLWLKLALPSGGDDYRWVEPSILKGFETWKQCHDELNRLYSNLDEKDSVLMRGDSDLSVTSPSSYGKLPFIRVYNCFPETIDPRGPRR
jgi:hypothetical protein